MRISIKVAGSLIALRPLTPRIRSSLEEALTYTRMERLFGHEAAMAGGHVRVIPVACFTYGKQPKRFITNSGYLLRVLEVLKSLGHDPVVKDVRPHPRPEIFLPRWDKLDRLDLRYMQRDVLQAIIDNPRGRIDCPTGYGKTFLIQALGYLWPKVRIDVVTKSVPVLKSIYADLRRCFPGVGIVGGGKKIFDQRIMCYCAASLHHAAGDPDVLIADEVHELATTSYLNSLAKYRYCRSYGLSASHDDRMDKADFELEGMFGPVIAKVEYQEAQKQGLIVQLQVQWVDVVMDINPCEDQTGVPKKRWGIWRNKYRNRKIAEVAKAVPDDEQVLITVETIEHAMYLKRILPDFTLVYSGNGLRSEERQWYVEHKFITVSEPIMTDERLDKLRRQFEKGQLTKVIATTVWNRGVDFRQLSVLIRGDAGGSTINDTQIPGRLSRICPESGKEIGVLVDFMDQFDTGFQQRSANRRRNYKSKGWDQLYPEKAKPTGRKARHRVSDSDVRRIRDEVRAGVEFGTA